MFHMILHNCGLLLTMFHMILHNRGLLLTMFHMILDKKSITFLTHFINVGVFVRACMHACVRAALYVRMNYEDLPLLLNIQTQSATSTYHVRLRNY